MQTDANARLFTNDNLHTAKGDDFYNPQDRTMFTIPRKKRKIAFFLA